MIHTKKELERIAALLHEKATDLQDKELFALYYKTRQMVEDYDSHINEYYVYSLIYANGGESRRKIFGPRTRSECHAYMNSLPKSKYTRYKVDKK